MLKKISWISVAMLFLICLYCLYLRFPTVTYSGDTELWNVELKAKLVGTEESYELKFIYKEEKSIDHIVYDIHPHYGEGWLSALNGGNREFFYQCEGCGYFDYEDELLIFIKWKERDAQLEYFSELFTLKKS
jgi:hypothetical protein